MIISMPVFFAVGAHKGPDSATWVKDFLEIPAVCSNGRIDGAPEVSETFGIRQCRAERLRYSQQGSTHLAGYIDPKMGQFERLQP